VIKGLALLVAFVVLGVAAAGCGSADQPESSVAVQPSDATAKAESGKVGQAGGEGDEPGIPGRETTGARGDRGAERVRRAGGEATGGSPSDVPLAAEGMPKRCSATFEKSTCEALAEAVEKHKDDSHDAIETGDCTEVLTEAECEAAYAARNQAAEAPDTVLMSGAQFRECLENPTPRCAELLGPILKGQRQSQEGSG
jgi:hypothetical protein